MCGIAGFIDHTLSSDSDRMVLLNKMLQSIKHRGPDAEGIYIMDDVALGHQRLSIIDLSENANQPMFYDSLVITYNGEIYNYVELRQSLVELGFHFKTSSDTEVILAAYQRWGADCVKKFVGMWAFVIWDTKAKRLFASRDRFGIKPFYYIEQSGRFYFGSEYKALKHSPLFSNELNINQIGRGIQLGWVSYENETYYKVLNALPPAHNLIIENKQIKINQYWDIESGKKSELSFSEKKEKFYELFKQSISLHMRSDVDVGSCLSGGIDSSAIVSMSKHLYPGTAYKSFSAYYDESGDVDERPFIREVLNKYPGIEDHYISPTDNQVEEVFHHALYHADVPCTGSSFISQYFLMKLIKEHQIKVVLDGQGSDEYLAGYMHSFYRLYADMMFSGHLLEPIALTMALKKKLGLNPSESFKHFAKSILCLFKTEQQLYSLEYRNYFPFLMKNSKIAPIDLKKTKGSILDNFLYHLIFHTSLPSLLHYEDRNSMAFGIESRVPFLDHRLVELSFQLDNKDKIYQNETKHILRQSLSTILPEAIKNRQDKKGFVTPGENKWLRGALSHLLEINFSTLSMIDAAKGKEIIRKYKAGDNTHAVLVWRLGVLHYWIKNMQ